jgi:hypothetical protein
LSTVWHVAALATFAIAFISALVWLRAATGRPFGLLAPLALSVMVCSQALLLNVLSVFALVSPLPIFLGTLASAGVLLVLTGLSPHRDERLRWRVTRRRVSDLWMRPRAVWLLAPLAVILALTAVLYRPTSWDAMTYHLSRVVHWVQTGSVAYYMTGIDRQNVMPPGAEYLLLMVQAISWSDRWANGVQFFAWIVCLTSVGPLCRIAGVPRRLCPFAVLFAASLPMGVMQAASTQTDLIASATVLGVIVAALPFVRRMPRWSGTDVAIVCVALSGAWLVKPTAVLVATPILAYAAWRTLLSLAAGSVLVARAGRLAVVGLTLGALVVGPDSYRKIVATGSLTASRFEVYPDAIWQEWSSRAMNPVLTLAQHSPWVSDRALRAMSSIVTGSPDVSHIPFRSFRLLEDQVPNPVHALTAAIILIVLLATCWLLPGRTLLFGLVPYAAWILFHLYVRNQPWISRLETPIFVISPLTWAVFACRRLPLPALRQSVLVAASILALAYGHYMAVYVEGKDLVATVMQRLSTASQTDRDGEYYLYAAYYPHNATTRLGDEIALTMLRDLRCDRLGLNTDRDQYEYPLVWRALQRGVRSAHYETPALDPCLIRVGNPQGLDEGWRRDWIQLVDGVAVPRDSLALVQSATLSTGPVPAGHSSFDPSYEIGWPIYAGEVLEIAVKVRTPISAQASPVLATLDLAGSRQRILFEDDLPSPLLGDYTFARLMAADASRPALAPTNRSQDGPDVSETTITVSVYRLKPPGASQSR